MLPCSCDEAEWKELLKEFNHRLQAIKKSEKQGDKAILTVRGDGMALLEGMIIKEFRFSRAAVKALRKYDDLKKKGCELQEIIQTIAKSYDVSSFQVAAFFKKVEKWVGNAEYNFINSLLEAKGRRLDVPLLVQWEVTAKCNLRCLHCYADTDGDAAPTEFKTGEALDLISELAEYGVRGIHFLGGEPFARPDILQLIEKASSSSMFSHISTNGTLITKEIARELATFDRVTVDISLDGVCPRSHDSFRGVEGTFDRVLQSLDTLKEVGVVSNVTAVLGRHNLADIEQLIDLAVNYEAKRIQFLTFSPIGRGTEAQKKFGFKKNHLKIVRKKILNAIFDYWDKIYIDAPMIGCNPLAFRTYEVLCYQGFELYYDLLLGCNAGISKAGIDFSGNLIPCPQVRESFGSLHKDGFLTAWNKLHSSCLENKICNTEDCQFTLYCGGKCRI